MKIEIKKSEAAAKAKMKQPYFFVLIADNGETVMLSEMYSRKVGCRRAIKSILESLNPETEVVDTTRKYRK